MSAEVAAEETKGPGIVLQPEEGQSYWQPIWANGYSIVKLSPKHAGPDNLSMGRRVHADAAGSRGRDQHGRARALPR
jgi:hypothetical protein